MNKTDWLLEQLDIETRDDSGINERRNADRALFHLLKQHRDKLPELDECFHKAFRQIDVTDSGHIDAAIWLLLDGSKYFWRLFDKAQKIDEVAQPTAAK